MNRLLAIMLLSTACAAAQNGSAPVIPSKTSTARDLHTFCKQFTAESGPSIEKAYCRGYVVGWRAGIEGTTTSDSQTVTFENDVTDDQMAKVFVLYMDRHPEEENKQPNIALLHAMLDSGLVTLVSPGKDNIK